MANTTQNVKLKVDCNTLSVWGVKKVESVTDRQAVLVADGKMVIKGVGLNVSKLDLDAGSIVVVYHTLESLSFGTDRGKLSLKGLLK